MYSSAAKGMKLQLPEFSVAGFREFTGSLRRHCEDSRQEASLGPLESMHLTAPPGGRISKSQVKKKFAGVCSQEVNS